MSKTAISALFAPGIVLLLVLAFFVGGQADAQTPVRLMFANQHCSEDTLSHQHRSGYLSLVSGASGVQTTLSATKTAHSSPYFRSFQVTHGAVTLMPTPGAANYVAMGTEPGFQAVHGFTHLSEVIDFYWYSFYGFGYSGLMKSFTPESMVYFFEKGVTRYWAEFIMVGDNVNVRFIPVAPLVASR